jgi:hypothetical protein
MYRNLFLIVHRSGSVLTLIDRVSLSIQIALVQITIS